MHLGFRSCMIFVKVGLKHFFWGLFPKPIFLMPLPKRLEPLTFNNKCSIDLMSIWTKKWFKLQGLCTNNFLYYQKFSYSGLTFYTQKLFSFWIQCCQKINLTPNSFKTAKSALLTIENQLKECLYYFSGMCTNFLL